MKIIKKQQYELTEIEVEIRYAEMGEAVLDIIRRIELQENYVLGTNEGRQTRIPISGIYYIESVDKKTFICTKNEVFRSDLRLYQFCDRLRKYGFVQVSKSCLVNIDVIDSIRSLFNSRLEATLINGERIHVSRTYLADIKAAFLEGML